MAKWHDSVPSEFQILKVAARAKDEGDAYRVHRFRYGAKSHRNALKSMAGNKLIKPVRGENPLMYFEITDKGRERLKELKTKEKTK